MLNKKISIITVCYNSEKTIGDTMLSVSSQNIRYLEHIIVDGGSTDATLEIINNTGNQFKIVSSESDGGIYDAMNKGIALASGDIIGFLNSDDIYASHDTLSIVLNLFDCNDVDSCYGDLCYVRKEDVMKIMRYWRSRPVYKHAFESGWAPPHPTFFVKRAIYLKHGGFDLNYGVACDFHLMARFLAVLKISNIYLPNVLVRMRVGGASSGVGGFSGIIKQNMEIRRALISLGLNFSGIRFFIEKARSRLVQFIARPDYM